MRGELLAARGRIIACVLAVLSLVIVASAFGRGRGPFWRGDFRHGTWSQYDSYLSHHMDGNWPTDYLIVRSPHPRGFRYAARYTTGPESIVPGQPGQRTLDSLWPSRRFGGGKTHAYQGASTWYRDDLYLPSSFRPVPDQDWNIVYELHNWPDTSAAADVSCAIVTTNGGYGPFRDGGRRGQRLSCRVIGGGSARHPADDYNSHSWPRDPAIRWRWFVGLRHVPRNRWIHMVFHIKWSWRSGGYFEWWVDGHRRAAWHGPTLLYYRDNGQGRSGAGQAYLEHGYYRQRASWATSLYHAATMIGPTAASVGGLG